MSDSPVKAPIKPGKRRKLKQLAGPIKPGQHLLLKPQVLELCGNPSYSTLWGWMQTAGFPLPLELGPRGGRTSRVAWVASEVYTWLAARPRREIGGFKQVRAAQETGKRAELKPPARRRSRVVKS